MAHRIAAQVLLKTLGSDIYAAGDPKAKYEKVLTQSVCLDESVRHVTVGMLYAVVGVGRPLNPVVDIWNRREWEFSHNAL